MCALVPNYQIVCTCTKLHKFHKLPECVHLSQITFWKFHDSVLCYNYLQLATINTLLKDAKITAIMDSIYINEFIEQIQKEHEEEKMSMMQENIKMIEEHKEFLDLKSAEWEI